MPPERAKAWVDELPEIALDAGVVVVIINVAELPYYFARINTAAKQVGLRLAGSLVYYVQPDGVISTIAHEPYETIKAALNLPEDWGVYGYTAQPPSTENVAGKLSPQE